MNDYYLKFHNERDLWDRLLSVGLAVETGSTVSDMIGVDMPERVVVGIALDIIGTIYKPTGNMITTTSEAGEMMFPEMTPIDGFYANLRGSLTEEQMAALPLIEKPRYDI